MTHMVTVMNYLSLLVRICIVMHRKYDYSINLELWAWSSDNKLFPFNLKNSEDTNKERK